MLGAGVIRKLFWGPQDECLPPFSQLMTLRNQDHRKTLLCKFQGEGTLPTRAPWPHVPINSAKSSHSRHVQPIGLIGWQSGAGSLLFLLVVFLPHGRSQFPFFISGFPPSHLRGEGVLTESSVKLSQSLEPRVRPDCPWGQAHNQI